MNWWMLLSLFCLICYLRVRGRKWPLRVLLAVLLPVMPHVALLWLMPHTLAVRLLGTAAAVIFFGWMQLFPCLRPGRPGARIQALAGGRALIGDALYAFAMQLPLLPMLFSEGGRTLAIDCTVAVLLLAGLLLNGTLRVLCLSVRLGVLRRVLVVLFLWIPGVNLLLLWYLCRQAEAEYDHACYKRHWQGQIESDACATKYPLVLLHGVGFRDLKYFNYWGRIPAELERRGAKIHYGNQEAWGTIEANAADVKVEILRVMAETGCEKVNVIAHSKGGLDARYMISTLGMADAVASVTTICTPHHGSKLGDLAQRLPAGLYRFVTKQINRYFSLLGDKNPDAFTAAKQFSSAYIAEFNECTPDMPGIYYQSYAATMRGPLSDPLLTVPYLLMRAGGAKANDGLVEIESAKWGSFRGVFRSQYRRGISHGDAIDLKREDYKGFDVVRSFVEVVADLRKMGY